MGNGAKKQPIYVAQKNTKIGIAPSKLSDYYPFCKKKYYDETLPMPHSFN